MSRSRRRCRCLNVVKLFTAAYPSGERCQGKGPTNMQCLAIPIHTAAGDCMFDGSFKIRRMRLNRSKQQFQRRAINYTMMQPVCGHQRQEKGYRP